MFFDIKDKIVKRIRLNEEIKRLSKTVRELKEDVRKEQIKLQREYLEKIKRNRKCLICKEYTLKIKD